MARRLSDLRARHRGPAGRRGLALVTVLWLLMLLALIAASFMRTTRTEINLTRNLIESAKAEALADAEVYRAIYAVLSNEEAPRFDKELDELLTQRPEFQDMLRVQADESDPRGGWRRDGTIYFWPFQDTAVWISIQDEGGKIDLNTAPDALLRGLFLRSPVHATPLFRRRGISENLQILRVIVDFGAERCIVYQPRHTVPYFVGRAGRGSPGFVVERMKQ